MKLSELIEIAEQDIKDLEDAKKSKLKGKRPLNPMPIF